MGDRQDDLTERSIALDDSWRKDAIAKAKAEWAAFARSRTIPPNAIAVYSNRADIIGGFAALPDEAFNSLVYQMWQQCKTNGGFREDSRAALDALRLFIDTWITNQPTSDPAA